MIKCDLINIIAEIFLKLVVVGQYLLVYIEVIKLVELVNGLLRVLGDPLKGFLILNTLIMLEHKSLGGK